MTAASTTSVAPTTTWDLSDLFSGPNDARIDAALRQCKTDAEGFATRFRGTIEVPGGPAPGYLREALEELEAMLESVHRVAAYSHMLYTADTSKAEHRNLEQQVRLATTEIQNLLVFFDLEWQHVEGHLFLEVGEIDLFVADIVEQALLRRDNQLAW